MSDTKNKNVAASVLDRLTRKAKSEGVAANVLHRRYVDNATS